MGYYEVKEGDTVSGKDDDPTKVLRVMEVIIARHGVKSTKKYPSDQEVPLVDSSPGSIYDKVRAKSPKRYDPTRIYLAHTDRIRTLQTALAIQQAKRLGGRRPKDLEDLLTSDNTGISSHHDQRMDIYPGENNDETWKKKGGRYVIEYGLQNREAVQEGGQLIEPHVSMESRMKDALRDGIEKVLSGQYDCTILVTHSYHAEIMRGIANGRGKDAKTVGDLGGEFDMEEFDSIKIAELADGTYKCYVRYGDGHVVERKLKDIVGYEVTGDKELAQARGKMLSDEERRYQQMERQVQKVAPAHSQNS